jgi:hypothetical protein
VARWADGCGPGCARDLAGLNVVVYRRALQSPTIDEDGAYRRLRGGGVADVV